MTGVDCTRASSTEIVKSPTLERNSVPVVRTFSATLVSAGKTTMNLQQIAHNRAGVIITFTYVNNVLLLIGEIIMLHDHQTSMNVDGLVHVHPDCCVIASLTEFQGHSSDKYHISV